MRFWDRRTPDPPSREKQTRSFQPLTGSFRQRRPFSDPRDETVYESKPDPSGAGQWLTPVEPTDSSKGGVNEGFKKASFVAKTYDITNALTDREYDANSTSTGELADVLATFIRDVDQRLNVIEEKLSEIIRA